MIRYTIKKYNIYVRTNKKEQKFSLIKDNEILVDLISTPTDNKANNELIELISLQFNVDKNNIELKGLRSKIKYITIKAYF